MTWSIAQNSYLKNTCWQRNNNDHSTYTTGDTSNLHTSPALSSKDKKVHEFSIKEYESNLGRIPIYLSIGRPLKGRANNNPSSHDNDLLVNFNRKIAWSAFNWDYNACQKQFNTIKQQGLIPDVYSYNSMIFSLMKRHKSQDALFLLKEMQNESIPSNIATCEYLMDIFKQDKDFEAAGTLLEEMSIVGITPNLKIYNQLMELYVSLRDLEGARALLVQMRQKGIPPNVSTYNILIPLYANPLDLLSERGQPGFEVDITIYSALLKFFIANDDLSSALDTLLEMDRTGIVMDLDTYNILLNCYAKNGNHVRKMHTLLEEMREREIKPNKETYLSVMQFCMKNTNTEENVELLKELQHAGILAHIISCNILMLYFRKNLKKEEACVLFQEMLQEGLLPYVTAYKSLIGLYLERGNLDAQKLKYLKSEMNPFQISIAGVDETVENLDISRDLFNEMQQADILPKTEIFENLIQDRPANRLRGAVLPSKIGTFLANLKAPLEEGKIEEHKIYLREMFQHGFVSDIYFCNRLIDTYIETNHIGMALELVDEMEKPQSTVKPDEATYIALMKGLKKDYQKRSGGVGECWKVYEKMLKAGIQPDVITFNTIFDICGKAGDLEACLAILDNMHQKGIFQDVANYTTLMGYYAKSGNLPGALNVLKQMKERGVEPDETAYAVLIRLCLAQKNFNYCDQLLKEMLAVVKKTGMKRPKELRNLYHAMIRTYLYNGRMTSGIMEDMKNSGLGLNVDTFNILLKYYVDKKDLQCAHELLQDMSEHNIQPNDDTYKILESFKEFTCLGM